MAGRTARTIQSPVITRSRRFVRHTFRFPVQVSSEGQERLGLSAVIAMGGMFMLCTEPLMKGSLVAVTMVLNSGLGRTEVVANGRVAYATDEGMGLEFLSLPHESYVRLRNFFRYHELPLSPSEVLR